MNAKLQRVKYQVAKLRDIGKSKRLYAYLICLLISFSIWFLIALSKNYTTVVQLPVRYVGLSNGEVVVNELPSSISLELNSYGFQLLSYELFSSKPIIINIDSYPQKAVSNHYESIAVTHHVVDKITTQLSVGTKVLRIWPDTIFMLLSDTVTKQLKVRLNMHINCKNQFQMYGEPHIEPATVSVFGPLCILDTMTEIYTNAILFNNVDKKLTLKVGMALDGVKNIKVKPKEVFLKIDVDEFTEGSTTVPITVVNIPKGYEVKVFPDEVTVKYNVGLKRFNVITPGMFKANVFLPDTGDVSQKVFFTVSLDNQPKDINDIRYEPHEIEVIMRKIDPDNIIMPK